MECMYSCFLFVLCFWFVCCVCVCFFVVLVCVCLLLFCLFVFGLCVVLLFVLFVFWLLFVLSRAYYYLLMRVRRACVRVAIMFLSERWPALTLTCLSYSCRCSFLAFV